MTSIGVTTTFHRHCTDCEQRKHHSRFRTKQRQVVRHGSMTEFRRLCKDCEQIERNERKNGTHA